MILILKNKLRLVITISTIAGYLLCTLLVNAQVSQTISVSPTLFEMTAAKEQTWQSELRVTNVNDYDITVYPQVVNFAPLGENGRGDFIPVFAEETKGETLAEWIDLPPTGITITRQETKTISFSVAVPKDAAPGGHYAAILIGTKPPTDSGSSEVQTAQFVTTLFFLKVDGDITELGTIRDFTTSNSLIPKPNAEFLLRFENQGNVHLQPQGDITIYNMWGEQRGIIPINQQTHFGNVLPKSIRQFTFDWVGEYSILDIGRYKAIATLGYGQEEKKFSTSITYFWIIPLKNIVTILVVLLILMWILSFSVKMYVKRMLKLAGVEPRKQTKRLSTALEPSISSVNVNQTVILKQYKQGSSLSNLRVRDFVSKWLTTDSWQNKQMLLWNYISFYRFYIVISLVLLLIVIGLVFYIQAVSKDHRAYQVTINNQGSKVSLSSEQIIYNSLPTKKSTDNDNKQNYTLTISNASGKPGMAADTRIFLEERNYSVSEILTDSETSKLATVVVYNNVENSELLKLSADLNNALISASSEIPDKSVIIYVGSDRENP